jgi:hypothetical protein
MMTTHGRLRLFLGCVAVACMASGCTPKRVVFHSDPTFPASRGVELKIVLAAPIDSLDLSQARDAEIRKAKDPGKALAHVKCVWSRGLSDLAHRLSKSTELDSDVLSDLPVLPRTSTWIHYDTDALSVPRFSLDDSAVLSSLDASGVDYVVVPQNLSLRAHANGGGVVFLQNYPPKDRPGSMSVPNITPPSREELSIETTVAIIDVHARAIVWTGVVSSPQRKFAIGTSIVEEQAAGWLVDLLGVLGRKMIDPGLRSPKRTLCD